MPLEVKSHVEPTWVENSLAYHIPPSSFGYHHYYFSCVLFMIGTFFLKRLLGLLPLRFSVVWFMDNHLYSTDSQCMESHPYLEEPLFSCFLLLLFIFMCTAALTSVFAHCAEHRLLARSLQYTVLKLSHSWKKEIDQIYQSRHSKIDRGIRIMVRVTYLGCWSVLSARWWRSESTSIKHFVLF